jgi:hypothetical protein
MAVIESHVRSEQTETNPPALEPGTAVEVQNRFTGSWCRGFEVTEAVRRPECLHYRIRRTSDGTVIPDVFGEDHIRPRR